jgi:putative zinc finger/helix-turn-helix YgiT family protein
MKMKVIRTEKRLCTCCMEEHDVSIVQVDETNIFKDTSVEYVAEYYYCELSEELYMDEKMISINDIKMKDAYRKKVNLLTSQEISGIRAKYGVSQADLCTIMGWGGKTITRYESHQVQDKAHDTILKKIDQDPEWYIELLLESKKAFPKETYRRYYLAATKLYENKQDDYLRKSIEAKYACFNDKGIYNGNAILSLDKVIDTVRYYSNSRNVNNLYKVKLMKLLWYADSLSYKNRGYAITGLVYRKLPMGAVPIGHDVIIELKGITYEEMEIGDGIAYKFCPSDNSEYPYLNDNDKLILDNVIDKFGNMSKDEIVSCIHNETAYVETKPKEIISFKYSMSLKF